MEYHHITGKANSDLTIAVPANDHRACLSENQNDWPRQTLENRERSPMRKAAANIRGFIDTVVYLAEELLLWVAEMLEMLDDYLAEKFGPNWWHDTPFNRFAKGGQQRSTGSRGRRPSNCDSGLS